MTDRQVVGRKDRQGLRAQLLSRGLEVSPEDIAAFPHDWTDIATVEAFLSGRRTFAEAAADIGISETDLRERLLDPIRCAWIATQTDHLVKSQLGRVHGAVFLAALATGDPARAKYLDSLYGLGPVERKEHLHVHLDLSGLTDEELEKFIKTKRRKLEGGAEKRNDDDRYADRKSRVR